MPEAELKTLHLTTPFRIAHGASSARQVVRVRERNAVGEAPFVPYYGESPEATLAWLKGEPGGKETRTGKLALDLLRLDAAGQPLWKVAEGILGEGRPWTGIHACRSFSIPMDLGEFAGLVRETACQFRVLKLKLGSGDLMFDEAIVKTARASAPEATLIADVNGGWAVADTLALMPKLAGLLTLIEQPIHHTQSMHAWQELAAHKHPDLPLFVDESVQNADDVHRFAELVDGVNVKLLKCASFEGAIQMLAAARQHGLGVILGCMIESSIGTTAAAHLAPWADYVDLDGHLYLSDDDYAGITFDEAGRLVMPQESGIGAKPRT